MKNNKLKLYGTKKSIELLCVNGIDITSLLLLNAGSNILIDNNYPSSVVNTCRVLLSIGILSVNLAYTNYNIYNTKKEHQKHK